MGGGGDKDESRLAPDTSNESRWPRWRNRGVLTYHTLFYCMGEYYRTWIARRITPRIDGELMVVIHRG